MITLKDDQVELVDEAVEKVRMGQKNLLIQACTGAGKTYIATTLMQRAYNKGKTGWFIVPRKSLLEQTSKTFTKFGLFHSFIAANRYYNPKSRLWVCSSQTLSRRLDKVEAPDFAFIDETHYKAAGLDEIIGWLQEHGTYIIGLTATP